MVGIRPRFLEIESPLPEHSGSGLEFTGMDFGMRRLTPVRVYAIWANGQVGELL